MVSRRQTRIELAKEKRFWRIRPVCTCFWTECTYRRTKYFDWESFSRLTRHRYREDFFLSPWLTERYTPLNHLVLCDLCCYCKILGWRRYESGFIIVALKSAPQIRQQLLWEREWENFLSQSAIPLGFSFYWVWILGSFCFWDSWGLILLRALHLLSFWVFLADRS